ncbi:hypothetical protein ZWY2020_054529 [Hordeum vulgare]|nr:hypothetical protein ZWY2020_054529 [Hordeum vulgare]
MSSSEVAVGECKKTSWPEVVGLTIKEAKEIILKDKPEADIVVVPVGLAVTEDFRPPTSCNSGAAPSDWSYGYGGQGATKQPPQRSLGRRDKRTGQHQHRLRRSRETLMRLRRRGDSPG